MSAFASALSRQGNKRKPPPTKPTPTPRGDPKGKNKNKRRKGNPKPGDADFSGCNGVFCGSGKRCGGDHYAGDHFRNPEKFGGKIKPKGK